MNSSNKSADIAMGSAPRKSVGINQLRTQRFKLVPYFTLASLFMFVMVAVALAYFSNQQREFFQQIKNEEIAFFRQVQDSFAKQQDEAARRDLLAIHESGNVNLTRLFANALWEKDFAPFVAKAQEISIEECAAIPDVKDEADGKVKAPPEKKSCFSEVGKKIMGLKGFADLNAKVYDSMKKSTVFKVKVFDLRGVTIYSSEHGQMGEDKSTNAGWKGAAVEGKPKSELTFRDKFSAFEGVVEKRDLISSYMPVLQPGSDRIVGVFEIYSDVTPFLDQIKATSANIKVTATANQAKVEEAAASSQTRVEDSENEMQLILLAMTSALFVALFLIVRRAAAIMSSQELDNQQAQQKLAQSEKMASLGQMVAGVAHQLNTPLAFTYNNVGMVMEALKNFALPLKVAGVVGASVKVAQGSEVTFAVDQDMRDVSQVDAMDLDVEMPSEMLKDTIQGIEQMREMVENLRDFTRLDRTKVAKFDLNKGLHNVIYIAKSVIPTRITVVEDFSPLPSMECNPSQLNQVFLNLINNAAQSISGDGSVIVRSTVDGRNVRIEVTDTGNGIPPDVLPHIWESYFTTKKEQEGTGLGLAIAKSIVEEHGGEITVQTKVGQGTTFTVSLPVRV
jgi:signal transduction histidine kinase